MGLESYDSTCRGSRKLRSLPGNGILGKASHHRGTIDPDILAGYPATVVGAQECHDIRYLFRFAQFLKGALSRDGVDQLLAFSLVE